MERQSSTFEYLCRVCAANTKGKNSVAECVDILKTPALKDKIEKYLYLTISEDDILPKVLCKACFRQVEATASLSKIAKHTQKVFRDFIFNAKSCLQAESSDNSSATNTTTTATPARATEPTTTPTNYAMLAPAAQPAEKTKAKDKAQVISSEILPPPPAPPCAQKDEVVVNVTVNDPLTRETQHKMINASRHRQNSVDTRFTPKSIAQRSFANNNTAATSAANKQSESVAGKKQSTPGVINFFPNARAQQHQQQQQQQPVTQRTSGGYVIGCVPNTTPTNNPKANEPSTTTPNTLQQKRRNLKTALNNIKTTNIGQVSLLKNSHKTAPTQQQQKQQTSQHPRSPPAQTQPQPPPKAIESPPTLLVDDDVIPAEPLPEKMIIASTKQKQKQKVYAAPIASLQVASPPNELVIDAESSTPPPSLPPQTEPTDLSQPNRASIPDDILLGKVIKDGDLLKLILKALKWPVNKHNMEDQLNRLRNSRFAHVMADPNLLQDADLTQIMGPYLGPVLQAAQMLQQQQIAAAAGAVALTKENELQVAGITTTLPYKLPAETSVQLVPASPEAETTTTEESQGTDVSVKTSASRTSLKRKETEKNTKAAAAATAVAAAPPTKRPRRATARGRSSSVFNTDNNDYAALNSTLNSQYLNTKSASDAHVDLDPSALFTQLSLLSGMSAASSNEALIALLQRQRMALSRLQQQQQQQQQQQTQKKTTKSRSQAQPRRQRRNSIITVPASGSDFAFDTDDIILMEPDDCTINASTTTNSGQINNDENVGSASSANLPLSQQPNNQTNNIFTVPQQQLCKQPIITRPIIKRRKTVIQSSPACMNLAMNVQAQAQERQAKNLGSTTANITTTTTTTTQPSSSSAHNLITPTTANQQKKLSKTQSLDNLNTIATQYPSNIISIGTQVPSYTMNTTIGTIPTMIATKATETTLTVTASAATSVTSLAATVSSSGVAATTEKSNTRSSKRQSTSKSALGQQLLEAIGLQKIGLESKNVTAALAPAPASSSTAVSTTTTTGARGSVQQIRSALKKSLQKAQEQQRHKKEEEEKSVNIVREVVVQPRNRHAAHTPVGELDVEEEINKITLVLQSKSKDDKQNEQVVEHLTVAAPTKIPGIRRKLIPPPTRNRKSAIVLVADEIVDLVDDDDNHQDSADGIHINSDKNKATNEKDKGKEKEAISQLGGRGDHDIHSKNEAKNVKNASPTRQRRRKLKPEEVEEVVLEEEENEEDDDDDEDNQPLKPKTAKNVNEKQDEESPNRAVTPRQRSRATPANGRKVPSERDYEKESDDEASLKNDNESTTSTIVSTRPSRVSKTMSRYYKGPDKSPSTPRRSISTRSGRVRN